MEAPCEIISQKSRKWLSNVTLTLGSGEFQALLCCHLMVVAHMYMYEAFQKTDQDFVLHGHRIEIRHADSQSQLLK